MNLEELLIEFHISLNKEKDIFQIFDSGDTYVIDTFPEIILDNEKYKQAEIFYQKVLDKELKRSDFEAVENQFINIVKTLWLYNDVDVKIICFDNIKKNYYYKKIRGIFRKDIKKITDVINNEDELYRVEDIKLLEKLCKLAIRDIAPVLFVFNSSKVLMLLNDCHAQVIVSEKQSFESIHKIVFNNHLYIYQQT